MAVPIPTRQAAPRRSHEWLGAILGIFTAFVTAVFLVCYRKANLYTDTRSALFAMFFCSACFNLVLAGVRGRRKNVSHGALWIKSVLFIALMSVIGNYALVYSLEKLDAGVTGLLSQLQIIFIAVGASFFLRESAGKALALGAGIAIIGFAIYTWPTESATRLDPLGLAGGLVYSLTMASIMIWTRAVIAGLDSVTLNTARLWLVVIALALIPNTLRGVAAMPTEAWLWSGLAAFCGPLLGRLAIMTSLRFISAAKTKLWGMLNPVFAFFLVYLASGTTPTPRELLGGAFIILGVLLPLSAKLYPTPKPVPQKNQNLKPTLYSSPGASKT